MAVGMGITFGGVWLYSHKDSFKSLNAKYDNGFTDQINPEFATYIKAFTTGYVPTGTTIKVKFVSEVSTSTELNTPLTEEYISFSPGIKGELIWKDAQTLEFKPKEKLKPGQRYTATLHLGDLVDVKKELKEFEFQFEAVKQSLQLSTGEFKSYNGNDFYYYSITGTVSTADEASDDLIEQTTTAHVGNQSLKLKWLHTDKSNAHAFLVDSIERPNTNDSRLVIETNGKPINVTYTRKVELPFPKKEMFRLLSSTIVNEEEQYVLLTFSNPVDATQSLEGLIRLEGMTDLKYVVSNNQVMIYPNATKTGTFKLTVESIRDTKGQTIEKSETDLVFKESQPAVRFASSGNILPSTNGLNLPFETVNLRAVDVKIIKIYENNILQFLQTNELDGGNNLAQVGKKVLTKRINLGITNPNDYGVWKKFSLDLSKLIKSEPGAIYRVALSFRKAYSTYSCLGNAFGDNFEMEQLEDKQEEETDYFQYYYDDYYGNYYDPNEEYEDYNWDDRNNPCKNYYYHQSDRVVFKNILASDLGLTVKKGNDGTFMVFAANLVDTKPMSGTTIELYDYQKQLIQTVQANADGQAQLFSKTKPYFIVAKKDKQRAYLRLDDGTSLSLSMYDVSGEAVKKGVKGFLYGERGVWRPGDSLFLSFMLEDKNNNIPDNHPVVLELYSPQGQAYRHILNTKSVNGVYNFNTATDKNAPTGLWTADVKVGSLKFTRNIRIETIMPNRLKINVNAGDNKLLSAAKTNMVTLKTAWLTGASARNLQSDITATLFEGETDFPKFKDYKFTDNSKRFYQQQVTVFEGQVNENGEASAPLKLEAVNTAPGLLRVAFTTRVFEQGGAFSIDRFSVDYSPYRHYIGVRKPEGERYSGILYTKRDHKFDIATVDENGNAVSRGNLKYEVYKLEWRWWWDQYRDEVANYEGDNYQRPIQSNFIKSVNGHASFKLNIDDNNWGRYLIRVTDQESGHSATEVVYFDWSNWMDRDGGEDGNSKIVANMLHFSTDKASYKTGEEVAVTIPSPQNGRALVTIENGSRVIEAHWLNTEKGSTVFKFKVSPQMAPTAYVHVSLIQPHSRTNDLPIRLYGVVPVNVDDPATHLKPTIAMPDVLMPEKKVNITVGEEQGKEMAFTLAVVDEGLLDITRFKTPNPWQYFYAREALGVKTWDSYDQVIGAYGAELERVLSIGGDGSDVDDDGAKANRFKPMVKFFGPYLLKKGEKKTISFQMPMYVGSVRTMLIAGNNGSYGHAEKTTAVKAPLMVLGTLPRVMSVTEEVKLPVSVFGGDKNIGNTQVKIEVSGALQLSGAASKNVNIKKDDEQLVVFDLKAKGMQGIGKVKIIATGGGHTSTTEIELDVRNPNPYQTVIKDFFVEAGKSLKETANTVGIQGTNKGMLELSTIPPINLDERLNYLITYPHGCVEQTTSQSFAQLYLSDIMPLNARQIAEVEANIKHGIRELQKFQLNNGAMSYWQGMNDANEWGTTYAGHFLLSAEKKGYTLPAGLKKSWINYQQSAATNFDANKNAIYNNDEIQAYRLYALALANQPALSAMNRLRELSTLSNQARWFLAAAYAQMGQAAEAEKLIAKASSQITPYRINYYTFGSTERDAAVVLQTLCLMGKKQQAFVQLKRVSEMLSSRSWMSTQSTAYCLVAVSHFIKKYGDASAMQAECTINGKDVNIKGNSAITQIPVDFSTSNAVAFSVNNNGKGVLYARLIARGKPAIGTEKEGSENISMEVVYKDGKGMPLNVSDLTQGTDFTMQVTVRNLGLMGDVMNMALSTYIPSGWEIHNSRMDDAPTVKSGAFTYQDIRDDRVSTYFDLRNNESKTFTIRLHAAYEGKYYLPAVNAEAMYDSGIYARNKGQWIKVSKGNTPAVAKK